MKKKKSFKLSQESNYMKKVLQNFQVIRRRRMTQLKSETSSFLRARLFIWKSLLQTAQDEIKKTVNVNERNNNKILKILKK